MSTVCVSLTHCLERQRDKYQGKAVTMSPLSFSPSLSSSLILGGERATEKTMSRLSLTLSCLVVSKNRETESNKEIRVERKKCNLERQEKLK